VKPLSNIRSLPSEGQAATILTWVATSVQNREEVYEEFGNLDPIVQEMIITK
jgi:hypothetical protein